MLPSELPRENSTFSSLTLASTTPMATPQLFSSFKYSDSLTLVAISLCTAVVCEAISWLLIYRTNSYKSLRSSIDKASKKLETMKTESSAKIAKKSKTKKMDRVETSLKESSRDLSLFKFKSGAVVALVLFVVFGLLNSLFEGKVVAKLPFAPFRIVMKMSHRGLHGDDATDCSMAFLYFLCSISIRTNLQKFLGFSPPRGASAGLFPMPDPKTN
ncbi:calcium load-activated calcium channel-like [Juglans regia]|uniref:Calcium load-activated calcium channel n=2 Tax=Juglans regia TaxID=51240 RepID=A0A2I4DRE4_JUGRE|nr:calcium load-activated calcium channel-like [Juglans regia]